MSDEIDIDPIIQDIMKKYFNINKKNKAFIYNSFEDLKNTFDPIEDYYSYIHNGDIDIDWSTISKDNLPMDFVDEFGYKIDWLLYSSKCNLTVEELRRFQDMVMWYFVLLYNQNLPEDFITEMQMKGWI